MTIKKTQQNLIRRIEESESEIRTMSASGITDSVGNIRDLLLDELSKQKAFAQNVVSRDDCNEIQKRLDYLRRQRAYLLDEQLLSIEAREKRDELAEWGVPNDILLLIDRNINEIKDSASPAKNKRFILEKILESYDFWDVYVRWSQTRGSIFVFEMFILIILTIYLSYQLTNSGLLWFGFIAAGICGASLSVLLKLPVIDTSGHVSFFLFQTIARLATGAIASLIGFGLLATGILNFPLSLSGQPKTIVEMIEYLEKTANARRTDNQEEQIEMVLKTVEKDELQEVAIFSHSEKEKSSAPVDEHGTVYILILSALGLLFGFSERLFASFEQTVLGSLKVPESGSVTKQNPG